MGATIQTTLDFNPGAGGTGTTTAGYEIKLMSGDDSTKPYELLFMALGSCLYSTFDKVYNKKRLTCKHIHIEISGEKRDEVPTFLKTCNIRFTVKGADNPSGFEKSFSLACKYCSIFQTLSRVAEMIPEIVFSD